ncbi:hypothetical protein GCM10025782_30870 [Pedococcus ginsenosidimutans]|uniref:RES domain-containing protein n=1 Tax=Pedococcus ginsenosidimutans TaxID=490570 RepID=A0ABP8YJR8_9MICO
MSGREQVAQGGPPPSLAGFPTCTLSTGTDLYRAHLVARGPWWFGNDGSGRFDLPDPRGACYTALDPASALRERVGPVLAAARAVPESLLEDVVVSRLALPADREVADLQSRAAGEYGVTRELETMVPYGVPQSWARALDRAGHHGVRYGPRFTPGDCSAVALFGDAGERDWPVDATPVPAALVPGGPAVVRTPRRADLTVVRPPRTRVPRT